MRLPRPSRFAIVTLLIFLALGVWLNLHIATGRLHNPTPPTTSPSSTHTKDQATYTPIPSDPIINPIAYPTSPPDPAAYPKAPTVFETDAPSPSDPVRWPTIPQDMQHELELYFGQPSRWLSIAQPTRRSLRIQWIDAHPTENPTRWMHRAELIETQFGFPFTARSTKEIIVMGVVLNTHANIPRDPNHAPPSRMFWPTPGISNAPPAITLHPLGLIANPILYALPVWVAVLLIRDQLIRANRRRTTKDRVYQ